MNLFQGRLQHTYNLSEKLRKSCTDIGAKNNFLGGGTKSRRLRCWECKDEVSGVGG